MKEQLKILVIDDDKDFLEEVTEKFELLNYKISSAVIPSDGYNVLSNSEIDIVFLDIIMPEVNGLEFLKKIKSDFPTIEVIMMTSESDKEKIITALRSGAVDFLEKPLTHKKIEDAIARTKVFSEKINAYKKIEKKFILLSNELKSRYGKELVGKSEAIKNVSHLISKVAKSHDTSVLIKGERGTGKELVAKGIHYISVRKDNIFYPVNCSSIPDSLFEGEFFGHKKGSFTGAEKDKSGHFENAHKGTLFLDEIGDMPLNQQAKLLRILEERKIRRVGSHTETFVDVRVVVATNRDIDKMVEHKEFRADLYDRLNRFSIHIPPLRERKEDIPLLANYFATEFSKEMKKPFHKISNKLLNEISNYHFPGNVRELKNIIESAFIHCDGQFLSRKHFPILNSFVILDADDKNDLNIERNEIRLIKNALKKTGGHQLQAAKLLGIDKSALNRRIKKYKINNLSQC